VALTRMPHFHPVLGRTGPASWQAAGSVPFARRRAEGMAAGDATIRVQGLDVAWETLGSDRHRGIVGETIEASSDHWGPSAASFNVKASPVRARLATGQVRRDDVRRSDTGGAWIVRATVWISLWLALFVAGCGSDEPTSADDASPSTTAATTATPPGGGESAIVGRWERVHKCSELLDALDEAGLRKVAPALIAEDHFLDTNAAELAQKDDPCVGAKAPFVHSHFFTASGGFGSLDENENQVDEGSYEVIDSRTIRIGGDEGVNFSYTIEGNTLMLSPVLTQAMVEEALATPREISNAERAIAVAYPGHVWKRVNCKTWC
jgi:hypothetical protein